MKLKCPLMSKIAQGNIHTKRKKRRMANTVNSHSLSLEVNMPFNVRVSIVHVLSNSDFFIFV